MNYFDAHADTLTEIPASENLWENSCNLDLRRVRQFAENYTQIFAVWKDQAQIPAEHREDIFRQLYHRAVELLREQSEYILWCRSASDMKKAHASGRAAAFLSVEDISIMGALAERVRELGFRFVMLTWNYENAYGCGAAADQTKGLTPKGREFVHQLQEQRMILDISHLSDQGVEDVFSHTGRPVMASHSNVRDICSHPRNLKNIHIKELIRRKGLMGINFYEYFTGENSEMKDLLGHVDAVLNMGGEDILAIGSDFDGCGDHFPKGINDVMSIPRFKALLEQEGFGTVLTEKLFFGNAHRFLMENLAEEA